MFQVRSGELASQLGGELLGSGEIVLRGIASLDAALAHDIGFLSDDRQLQRLQQSAAGKPSTTVHAAATSTLWVSGSIFIRIWSRSGIGRVGFYRFAGT